MNTNIDTDTRYPAPKTGRGAWQSRTSLGFIFSVVLLDVIGLGLLMPIQAYIVRQYSDEALMVSMIPVLYASAQFLAAPLLGKLSDRFGRRPVLLISILGSAVGYFLFGVGGALWVLFLSRLIDGFTAGNASIASAYVADVTPPQDRAKNYGFIGMAYGLGFILGPTLGGLLSQISLDAPVFAAGTLSLLAVVGFFILPESLPKEKRLTQPLRIADLNPFGSIFEMLRRPTVGGLLIVQCLFFFVFNGNNIMLPVFMIDKFGALPWQIACSVRHRWDHHGYRARWIGRTPGKALQREAADHQQPCDSSVGSHRCGCCSGAVDVISGDRIEQHRHRTGMAHDGRDAGKQCVIRGARQGEWCEYSIGQPDEHFRAAVGRIGI